MNINRVRYLAIVIMTMFISLFIVTNSAFAAEINFSVNTVIPDNQIDNSKTYFNLKMSPNQQQDITTTLKNDTKKDVTVNIGVNTAKTNVNGVVEYGKMNTKNDRSLIHDMSDVVKGPSSVVIPANSSKDVVFHIAMPKASFDGILLGGLTFQQKSSEVNQATAKSGTTIQNEYAYAVAIMLKETDKLVTPNLNLLKVEPGQNNHRNVINANVQNDQAVLLSDVKIDAKVYAKDSKKPVYTAIKNGMQIAPNSHFDYPISLNGTEMAAGEYTLRMKVTGTANKKTQSWQFTKKFKIASSKANDLNRSDVDLKANSNNRSWLYPLIGIILVLIIGILIFVVIKQRKRA